MKGFVSCCSPISPFLTFIHWVQIGSLAALVHSDNAKRLLWAHQSPDTLISTAPSYLIWSIARSWSKCDCTLCLWFTFLAKRWMDTLQVRWVTGEIEQSCYVLSHCEIFDTLLQCRNLHSYMWIHILLLFKRHPCWLTPNVCHFRHQAFFGRLFLSSYCLFTKRLRKVSLHASISCCCWCQCLVGEQRLSIAS